MYGDEKESVRSAPPTPRSTVTSTIKPTATSTVKKSTVKTLGTAPETEKNSVNLVGSSGIGSIKTENYANKKLEYYYYIPENVLKDKNVKPPLLVAVPGLSGAGKRIVSRELKEFAERDGVVIVAPSFRFDEKNWDSKKSYHYPSVWSGGP